MRNILIALASLLSATTATAAGVSGTWELAANLLNDVSYFRLTLQTDGEKLTGTLGPMKVEGTVVGDDLSFKATRPNGERFAEFKGKVSGSEIRGTATSLNDLGEITWSAKRAATPPDKPQVHDFEPKEFHRVFSDAIPPALRIFPGDTVRTWTVDAGGRDSKGVRRSQGGNPETGPFYIEGALPGDTLVVKLLKVQLNRDSAASGSQIVGSALNAGYVERTRYAEKFDSGWTLDRAKGTAQLTNPSAHLQRYTVKLQPMIGCLAVAPPAHQAFRTGYLGPYGGNMDYNQLREGTTVYLPVFAPGALLFIGDGHAAQGDGELTGDALETSMDVQFSVDLVRGFASGGPRAETDDYLMSSGIGNSLSEAMQLSTTQLVNWLQRDYKLEPNEAAVVLGTSVQYDVAEVVDPLVHVVAKVRKDVVSRMK